MLRAFPMLVCLAAVSCANPSSHRSWYYNHTSLSSQPTPREWRAGSVWRFITSSRVGKADILTVRITDQTAKSCNSGKWRKLVLLEGNIGRDSEPAYLIDGRVLWVSLNANICDDNDDIRGTLTGATFDGDRVVGGMFGGKFIGNVKGQLVQP